MLPGPDLKSMSRWIIALALLASACGPHPSAPTAGLGTSPAIRSHTSGLSALPLAFVPNAGQFAPMVAFRTFNGAADTMLTASGFTTVIRDQSDSADGSIWTIQTELVGASPLMLQGAAELPGVVSYFKGTPERWITGLPTFAEVEARDAWPGIDLHVSGSGRDLKSTWTVQPGVDPRSIQLAYRGASSARVNEMGELELETALGTLVEHRPVALQMVNGEHLPVTAEFALTHGDDAILVTFEIGPYDPARALVIDPVVTLYSGFIGGSGDENGLGLAVDSAGNAYVAGNTSSTEATFPVTVGPSLVGHGGLNEDAFVAKVSPDGSSLIYAGFIGGNGRDQAHAITVDSAGNAYVTGNTASDQSSFPVLGGPDLTHNGFEDAFVAKINPAGTALVYAGYIGGLGTDDGEGIAVDTAGSAYVTGFTGSTVTFPIVGTFGTTYGGGTWDGYISKVSADGSALVYSGFIGGSGDDEPQAIVVDGSGNAYVAGATNSPQASFPVTVGPDLTYNGGTMDAFVLKLNPSGTALIYAGYIGGTSDDFGNGIAIDSGGNAYVVGITSSTQSSFRCWVDRISLRTGDMTPLLPR